MNLSLEQFKSRPDLRHLKRLTTKDGLIQHADHEVPDPSFGYSIDDNARALIACLWHYQLFNDSSVLQLARIYLHYIARVEKEGGSFHNFLSFSEEVLDAEGSEDSIGRAIWALGEVIAADVDSGLTAQAKEILSRASISKHLDHAYTRTKAYILLGLIKAGNLEEAKRWADRLVEMFESNSSDDWPWFEPGLYYANGVMPYVMVKAAQALNNEKYQEIAIRSFDWLDTVTRKNNIPSPVGQNGWSVKGEKMAEFDQQPLEASDMVLASCELFRLTNDKKYLTSALDWIGWYYGVNIEHVNLINEHTGGIYDGITPGGVNKNQGAESIATYLLAYLNLTQLIEKIV